MAERWGDPLHPEHRPPRGYSRPPFAPGNTAAVTHGATMAVLPPGVVREMATAVLGEELVERYPAAGCLFGELWERRRRALLWLEEHGLVDQDGKPSPLLGYLSRWENTLLSLLTQFGQTPAGEVGLRRAMAELEASRSNLDALAEVGRRTVEERRSLEANDGR